MNPLENAFMCLTTIVERFGRLALRNRLDTVNRREMAEELRRIAHELDRVCVS